MPSDDQSVGEHRPVCIGHVKHDDCDVYIGRGPDGSHLNNTPVGERGWLGNPYTVEEHGREACIDLYAHDFAERMHEDEEFMKAVRDEVLGSTLGCWCRRIDENEPSCHGDAIHDLLKSWSETTRHGF